MTCLYGQIHDVAIVVWIFAHDRKTVACRGKACFRRPRPFWPGCRTHIHRVLAQDVTYAPRCPKLLHDKQSYTHASRPGKR